MWTIIKQSTFPFNGCVLKLKRNKHSALYSVICTYGKNEHFALNYKLRDDAEVVFECFVNFINFLISDR